MNDEMMTVITLDTVGASTGKAYKGVFKLKLHLNGLEQLEVDEKRRLLLGTNAEQASAAAKNLAYYYAQLGARILQAPEWWDDSVGYGGSKLVDLNVAEELIDLLRQAVEKQQDGIRAAAEKARSRVKEKVSKDAGKAVDGKSQG